MGTGKLGSTRAGHQRPPLPRGIPPATRGGGSSLWGAPVLLKTMIAALMGSASITPNLVAMPGSAASYVSGREQGLHQWQQLNAIGWFN
jgi:hypothetical protein